MSTPNFVPLLPESAPFTAEQRAYLNGFFAGLFSRVPAAGSAGPAPAGKPLEPLTILFGSQTGNAENLAKRVAKEAGKRGFAPTIHEMAKYPTAQLASEKHVLVVTSTYGDGDPPDNAKTFGDFLTGETAPKLGSVRFSVCALGDSNYPKFCEFGKRVDARLESLGATRAHTRADCDVEYEEPFLKWLSASLGTLVATGGSAPTPVTAPTVEVGGDADAQSGSNYSRKNPFPAPLVANRHLNGPGSAKDTRHFAFSLEGSGLTYEAGDALGVIAMNCADHVDEIVRLVGGKGDEPVPTPGGGPALPLREALLRHYEITKIPQPFLNAVAEKTGDAELRKLVAPGVNGELKKFLWGREIIDLLHAYPAAKFTPAELVGLLKKLQPRLYSISSSPKAHTGEVHLCVGVVRYDSLGRARKGVCSTFLAERVPANAPVPVFVHTNKNFRPPADLSRPMIMVGPGTGIAPFRGFLHERRATGATGRNWLFFGDQKGSTDFLFRDELETLRTDGSLTRLDTAFSRDQAEKVYVQQRMIENASEIFAWLESGAHFYVCGDASRMAKDVDAALHQLVQTAGGKNTEQAAEYVQRLKAEKRYQRDVY